jgi:hypothetical protein
MRHPTGTPQSIRATCNCHKRLHICHRCRAAATRQEALQALAFFSKKLNLTEQKYSAYNSELLVIYEAVKHFRHMLEVRRGPC